MVSNRSIDESAKVLSAGIAAGSTDSQSSSVDMQGYEGCKIYTCFGAIVAGAVTSVEIQTSSDDSTFNDLAGSSVTVADDDDDDVVIHDIYRPLERYLRVDVNRATQNATVDYILAVRYGSIKSPATDDATVISKEIHASPAEGTA